MKPFHSAILILVCFTFCGCHKKSTFSFKGRIIREVNSEPLKQAEILLIQEFEKGSPRSSNAWGPYYTDDKGEYEFKAEITHYNLENFHFNIYDQYQSHIHWVATANTDGDFQMIYFPDYGAFDFHIVNQNPVDSNDFFKLIQFGQDTSSYYSKIYPSLSGTNVDVHQLTSFLWGNKLYYFKYEYTKGGIDFSTPFYTVNSIGLDTVTIDVNY